MVLVLIGTGWSYMRPFVDERTRRVLLVVIPLQVQQSVVLCGVVLCAVVQALKEGPHDVT